MELIFSWLGYFFLGLIWDLLIAINTRLLTEDKPKYLYIFCSSVVLTIVWGLIIQSINVDKYLIIPYGIACGFGSVLGVVLHKNVKKQKKKTVKKKTDLKKESI